MRSKIKTTLILIVLLCAEAVAPVVAVSDLYRPPPKIEVYTKIPSYCIPDQYKFVIRKWCVEYQVPVWVAARLFEEESGFESHAVNFNLNEVGKLVSTDRGIAMFNSKYDSLWATYWDDPKQYDPFDPYSAIKAAIKIVSEYHAIYKNWYCAVAAYNCGKGRCNQYVKGSRDLPETTKVYLDHIFGDLSEEDCRQWRVR